MHLPRKGGRLLTGAVAWSTLKRGEYMQATVSVEEAASNFAELLARVTAGEEVVIASEGKPVARLAPVEKGVPRQRIPDLDKGKIWVAPDFDDPLPEFEKEFYGE